MPQAPNPLPLIAIMFAIFYFIVIQPQNKARKQHEAMLKGLKKFDEVVTAGGLFGTVLNVKPESVTLRVDDSLNVKVEVEKTAVARLVKSHGADAEPAVVEKRS